MAGCDVKRIDIFEPEKYGDKNLDKSSVGKYEIVEILEPESSGISPKALTRSHPIATESNIEIKRRKLSESNAIKADNEGDASVQQENVENQNPSRSEKKLNKDSNEVNKREEKAPLTRGGAQAKLKREAFEMLKIKFRKIDDFSTVVEQRILFNDAALANSTFSKLFELLPPAERSDRKEIPEPEPRKTLLQEILDSCEGEIHTPETTKKSPRPQSKSFIELNVDGNKENEVCVDIVKPKKQSSTTEFGIEDIDFIFLSDDDDRDDVRTKKSSPLESRYNSLGKSSKLVRKNQSLNDNLLDRIVNGFNSITPDLSEEKEDSARSYNNSFAAESETSFSGVLALKKQSSSNRQSMRVDLLKKQSTSLTTFTPSIPRSMELKAPVGTNSLRGIKSLSEMFKFNHNQSSHNQSLDSVSSSGSRKLQLKATSAKNPLNMSASELSRKEKLKKINESFESHRDMSKYLDDFCQVNFIENSP